MGLYKNFPWLRNRELIILEITSELIFFILFLLVKSNKNYDYLDFVSLIPFICFWITISYLVKNLFSILFICLSYFFICNFLNLHNQVLIDDENLFIFLIQFALLNFTAHSLYLLIFSNNLSSKKYFILACNYELNEKIKNIFVRSIKDFKIKFTTYDSIDYSDFGKYKNIIYEDTFSLQKLNYKEFPKNDIKKIYYINWIEQYFQIFPFQILNQDETTNIFDRINPLRNQLIIKRVGDILCSILILIFSLPIILLAAFFIYFEDKGPILYSQIRNGQFEKKFKIYKLRSMQINAEQFGAKWSKKNDPRITKIGIILRKFRIDELPQLWNVIKGDMSLIGPRPERPEFDKRLKEKISNYELRFRIKPGLSGWAQVNYPYGASLKDSSNKLSYDLFYMKNYSLLMDILILFKTINLVINARGGIPIE